LAIVAVALVAACGGNVPILMFHSVAPSGDALTETPQQLDAQLDYLAKAGFVTVSLREVIDAQQGPGSLPAHPIVLTFDDGFEDAYQAALPLLKKRGQKATFFIVSGFTGADAAHRVHEPATHRPYLIWSEVRALHEAGMEIGSHTVSHAKLTGMKLPALRHELRQSKHVLEQGLGVPIDFFAYPYTSQHSSIRTEVHNAGYRGAVVGARGGDDPFQLQRITMHSRMTVQDLRALLSESWATGYTTGGG
jgi:peptidoglycan/xylan/chitin deacetylase (PgdA/CDA1 family)